MSRSQGLCCLGMLARYPQPGRTKTRLAQSIGARSAAELSACFTADLIARCQLLAEHFVVAATPETPASREWFQQRLGTIGRLTFQSEGSLGRRIERLCSEIRELVAGPSFDSDLSPGTGVATEFALRIVLIGSDSPDLPSEYIQEAFSKLNFCDVVFSPASDGGFVLVGLSCPCGQIFNDIRWSTEDTLHDAVEAARAAGRSVQLLPEWYDVDRVEDLKKLAASLNGAANSCNTSSLCPETAEYLRKHRMV